VWNEQQKLTASEGAAGDVFGFCVSVSGDTAVIGAFNDDGVDTDSGSAYVYVRSGAVWTQQQKLTAADGETLAHFGNNVSVTDDTAVVGAYKDGFLSGFDAGAAYVFLRSGGVWTQQQKLTASDGASDDQFGYSVSVNGVTVVVGANLDDNVGINDGSAYVFQCTPCSPPDCNNHGTCNNGTCLCDSGWTGSDCAVPLGTCCISNGSCETAGNCRENITPSDCQALGGRFLGPSVSCAQACVNGACIPTVSTWGVIVLLLLLTTVGTTILARRRVPAR
jgi:hypothetical protein